MVACVFCFTIPGCCPARTSLASAIDCPHCYQQPSSRNASPFQVVSADTPPKDGLGVTKGGEELEAVVGAESRRSALSKEGEFRQKG